MQLFYHDDRVQLWHGDARKMNQVSDACAGLVLTCPPWWDSGDYDHPDQIGFGQNYIAFMSSLNEVWAHCYRFLLPGRAIIVWIADLLWRDNSVALVADTHHSLQEAGFVYESTYYWFEPRKKPMTSKNTERVPLSCRPKVHAESILIYRKPGESDLPEPDIVKRSYVPEKEWRASKNAVWMPDENLDPPYKRLIRLWSYHGETILNPFSGQGTIALSARSLDRNCITVELNPKLCNHISQLLTIP